MSLQWKAVRQSTWLTASIVCFVALGCQSAGCDEPTGDGITPKGTALLGEEDHQRRQRESMVEKQLRARDIRDPHVLKAMTAVPRHEFVPENLQSSAYRDHPLPIGNGQTISQPYIVALMTQLAAPTADSRALDVGTGSGYQAAVLGEIVDQVFSIEIVASLAEQAERRLKRLGYQNIEVRHGDGYQGWPDQAPFDLIMVAAAPDHIPQPLVEQLAPGGRMIIPVGEFAQVLTVILKLPDGSTEEKNVAPVAFVPMTGQAQKTR